MCDAANVTSQDISAKGLFQIGYEQCDPKEVRCYNGEAAALGMIFSNNCPSEND